LRNQITRARAVKDRYDLAEKELAEGNFAAAAAGFKAVLDESKAPEYNGGEAKRLLSEAEKGVEATKRHAEVETLVDTARKLAASGDLVGARDKYDQAREADPSLARISEERALLEQKIEAQVEKDLRLADTSRKLKRKKEALDYYEKAVRQLRANDPKLAEIREKMNVLRK
jgi:tetratricopeptide (TPR) repeat protein